MSLSAPKPCLPRRSRMAPASGGIEPLAASTFRRRSPAHSSCCWRFGRCLSATGVLSPDVIPSSRKPYGARDPDDGSSLRHHDLAGSCLDQHLARICRLRLGDRAGHRVRASAWRCYRLFGIFGNPILSFNRPVPAFTLITVLIIWFGIGELPKILLVFLAVFPPMTVYTSAAMAAMPPDLADAARSLGASRWQILVHVRLVTALPEILSGMRVLLASPGPPSWARN